MRTDESRLRAFCLLISRKSLIKDGCSETYEMIVFPEPAKASGGNLSAVENNEGRDAHVDRSPTKGSQSISIVRTCRLE